MWEVLLRPLFEDWLNSQSEDIQARMYAAISMLEDMGPRLGRPLADSIQGSSITNLKELRVQVSGKPIRAFFAFDPIRRAIILCAGDKSNDKRFYPRMIATAEKEFEMHMKEMKNGGNES